MSYLFSSYIISTMSQLLSYVRKLNIFQTKDEDKHEYKNTLISTRIYFILMILILLGLILSLSVIPQMTTITINSPTYEQMKTFPLNVQCICSRLSIRYGTFLTLTTDFHQICSSDFITHRWIETIYSGRNSTHFYSGDFREIGSSQFQSLSSLCFLSRTNLEDNLNSFYDTSLINSQLIFENLLQTTIESSIEQLKMILPVSFKSQLNLMNKLIFGNQFLSGLKTILNIKYFHENQTSDFFINYLIYQNSTSCLNDYSIVIPSGFYNIQSADEQMNLLFEIPGFRSGCLPINSLLQSTLECFYNQTCINIILSYYSTSETFQSLNPLQSSIFTKEMTIQSMLNQMMIEELILNISYENYFHECAPISCSYSINRRNNFLMVLIQLISLLSGLKLILENLIPNFIRFIRKPKIQSSKPKISFSMQFIQLKSNAKTRLIELNLFPNENDPHNYSQRIGTRFYVFILLISLTSLTIYSSIVKELTHEIISNPTEFVYNELYQKYSTNLNCPFTENNQLISGYATNWVYEINEHQTYLHTLPMMYNQCDCGLSSKCTKSLNETKIGCYPLESFLQTTFQCFYNQQCIDSTKTFHALNYSTSRFNRNLTFESILQELMVENYSFELSYEKYFNQCLPSTCTYSYIGYRNIIDIITFLIGLYGGLMILSQWMTVFLLEIYKCRIQQIHPDTE
ncbi:hypothetical protein I4U23_021617 [Adineta vaga]|nr:hypothetical protein I4U23_021617 [Adineta vaga]